MGGISFKAKAHLLYTAWYFKRYNDGNRMRYKLAIRSESKLNVPHS